MVELHKTDKAILNVLLGNGKLSYREIGKKVGVSVVTILKRVKRMEQEKIIRGYTVDIDYETIGYEINVIIKIRIAKGKLLSVEKKIASDAHVVSVFDLTGDFDCMILARFKNRRSMDRFLKKIQTYDFVQRTETSFILNTIKEKHIDVE